MADCNVKFLSINVEFYIFYNFFYILAVYLQ